MTLHRPSNVDDLTVLRGLIELFLELARCLPLVFPVHPRTRAQLRRPGCGRTWGRSAGSLILEPLSYRENLGLMSGAKVVLTDSGGIQEETAWLGVPCLTVRETTERPVTMELGTSTLVGSDPTRIRAGFLELLEGRYKRRSAIPLWDGRASDRIAMILRDRRNTWRANPPGRHSSAPKPVRLPER